MPARRRSTPVELHHNVTRITLPDGRQLSPGYEVTLKGGGRYRYHYQLPSDGSLALWGPLTTNQAQWRAIRPERVRTVHQP